MLCYVTSDNIRVCKYRGYHVIFKLDILSGVPYTIYICVVLALLFNQAPLPLLPPNWHDLGLPSL